MLLVCLHRLGGFVLCSFASERIEMGMLVKEEYLKRGGSWSQAKKPSQFGHVFMHIYNVAGAPCHILVINYKKHYSQ